MMAMLDLIDDGGELAPHPAVQAGSEDRGNLVGGEPPQVEFAAALEQFVNGKVALENEVAAILDLGEAEYMTAPERFADSQIPLAPRAPSIHDPFQKSVTTLL